jgi:hypothetical protein
MSITKVKTFEDAQTLKKDIIRKPKVRPGLESDGLILEYIPIKQRTEELIRKFSDKFREVFSNPPYGQYLFDPEDNKVTSAQEVFGTEKYVEVEHLDNISLSTKKDLVFCHHPEKTFDIFLEKLTLPDSFLSVLKDPKDKSIKGATCTYVSDLKSAFCDYEEWNNPYLYSKLGIENSDGNLNEFLIQLRHSFESYFEAEHQKFTAETKVMVWNCVFLSPEARRVPGRFQRLMNAAGEEIPKRIYYLPLLAEMVKNTKSFEIFKVCKLFDTNYALGKDHSVFAQIAKQFIEPFLSQAK